MHKNSKVNEKLIVQPVFVSLMHQHRFMGPCRYGFGEELSYEFDHNAAEKDLAEFNSEIAENVDPNLKILLFLMIKSKKQLRIIRRSMHI